jgi:hypothetical protein
VPGLGEAVPELLDRLHVAAGPQGGQDPLAGPGQGGRRRVQVLGVVVGQHLHAVGQRGSEVNGVLGADATADAEPSVGNLPTDQPDPQHDRAGPIGVAAPVVDRDRADDPGPGGRTRCGHGWAAGAARP